MTIDYAIELPCEPKRQLGAGAIRGMLRLMEEARATRQPSAELRSAARVAGYELRPLAYHCARCPASPEDEAFSCFGAVQLPISAEAEAWLHALLPASLKPKERTTAELKRQMENVRTLIRDLQELGVTGERFDEQRANKAGAERKRALVRKYGTLFRPIRLKTSQILEALLLRDRVNPETAELLCRALGLWEDGKMGEDGLREVVFTEPPESEDDPSVNDLKHLFHALMVGCSLGVETRTQLTTESPALTAEPIAVEQP